MTFRPVRRAAMLALSMLAAASLIPDLSLSSAVRATDQPIPPEPRVAVLREGAVWVLQPGERFAPVPHSDGADRALFSPDGRFLAVHKSGGELWLIALSGGRAWLVAKDRVEPDFSWAPAGAQLAYIRGRGLWVVPCGAGGPVDWELAAPEVERFAWSRDGNSLFVATPAWTSPPSSPPPSSPNSKAAADDVQGGRLAEEKQEEGSGLRSPLPRSEPVPGIPVRRLAVRILEVKWRGGAPSLWGELPLTMPNGSNRKGPGIWGVDSVYPEPGGRSVAVAVRDAPDAERAEARGVVALTGRSASPVWLSSPGKYPLAAVAGWAEQDDRSWFAFLSTGSLGRSILCAWSPSGKGRSSGGAFRILTPEKAEDRFAAPHTDRKGWIVSRAAERPWSPGQFGPAAMWAVRPDGRSVRLSRPPLGREDVAGWWGPGEQWVWLRADGRRVGLWWWPRMSGDEGELLLDDIPRAAAIRPGLLQVLFLQSRRAISAPRLRSLPTISTYPRSM